METIYVDIYPVRQWRWLVRAAIDAGIESAGEYFVYLAFANIRPDLHDSAAIIAAYGEYHDERERFSTGRNLN